jgi:hypothetical protein
MRRHVRNSILRKSYCNFSEPKVLLLVDFVMRKTTARYDGRRSNSFPSTSFCRCRALDRRVNFSEFGHPRPPDNIPGKADLGAPRHFVPNAVTLKSPPHVFRHQQRPIPKVPQFSIFVRAEPAPKIEISKLWFHCHRRWRKIRQE